MLLDRRFVTGLAGLWTASTANAACSSNLVIDDFTKWVTGLNNLDWQNGGQLASRRAAKHRLTRRNR